MTEIPDEVIEAAAETARALEYAHGVDSTGRERMPPWKRWDQVTEFERQIWMNRARDFAPVIAAWAHQQARVQAGEEPLPLSAQEIAKVVLLSRTHGGRRR